MIAEDKLSEQIELVLRMPLEERKNTRNNWKDRIKLCEYLYLYVIEKYKYNKQLLYEGNYEEYGLEIFQTSLGCISNFDPNHESGIDFLKYFQRNWQMECSRIRGKMAIENKQVHVPDTDVRHLRVLINYLEEHNIVFSPTLYIELAAEVMNVSLEKAREIINMHFLQTGAFVILDDECEEISILETIPDGGVSIEEIQIRKENWNKVMEQIEEGFVSIKRKPGLYVIDVFTCDVARVLLCYDEGYSYQYLFINIPKMDRILSLEEGIPSGKEIAQEYNITQQTLSRAYSNVVRQIKDYRVNKTKSDLQQEQK